MYENQEEEYNAELSDAEVSLRSALDFLDGAAFIARDLDQNQKGSQIDAFINQIRGMIMWIEEQ